MRTTFMIRTVEKAIAALAHSRWSSRTATTSADEDFSHIDASLNNEVDGHADSQTGAFAPLPLAGRSSKMCTFSPIKIVMRNN
jgi:hypothetical protein